MSEATLAATGPRPVLRIERHLSDPIEVVWNAVTEPVVMHSWFPTRIEIDEWKIGATLMHHFDDYDIGPVPGSVLEWDPLRRVSFTWELDTITFALTSALEGGTVFVLTEELRASHAARNAAGWDGCLDRLQFARERESWTTRFNRYSVAFEAVLGPQEGPPGIVNLS